MMPVSGQQVHPILPGDRAKLYSSCPCPYSSFDLESFPPPNTHVATAQFSAQGYWKIVELVHNER